MKRMLCLLATVLILIAGVSTGYCDCNLHAYPETPQAATAFVQAVTHYVPQPNPTDVQVTVGATTGVMITPTIQVATGDVGSPGFLILYIYVPASNYGVNIPGKQVTLGNNQFIDLLPNPLDFSNAAGLSFIVYYGYVNGNGTIMYNAYTVNVAECVNNTIPPCSIEQDQQLCETIDGCVWQRFPTQACIVDCARYNTDEQTCNNAYDGKICHWVTPFANICATQ